MVKYLSDQEENAQAKIKFLKKFEAEYKQEIQSMKE
jgi:hypothetical protein